AERDLGKGERQLADQVRAVAHEDLVRADVEHHVNSAGGPAEEPARAFAAEPHLVAVLDPGRDGDLEQALAGDAALAPAGGAGVPDDAPLPVALGARTSHRQEALREAHLALTAARGAGLRAA